MEDKNFNIKMTKNEMLRFFANKIIEGEMQKYGECNSIVEISKYNESDIKLEDYKNEILQFLYKDERVADVELDDQMNLNIIFYTDFCPFYYKENDKQNSNIINRPLKQMAILAEFASYIQYYIQENDYTSTRRLINNYVEEKAFNRKQRNDIINFLKSNMVKTGLLYKYMENGNIYISKNNYQEFQDSLLRLSAQIIVKERQNSEQTEEFE